MGSTLGGRIFAAVAAALGVLFVVGALLAEGRIRSFGRTEVERRLAALAAVLEATVRPALLGRTAPREHLEALRRLPLGAGVRLTLVAADGSVLADTVAALPLENHGERPEILAAAGAETGADARTSASTGEPTLYFARRLKEGGRTLGYIRLAEPLEAAEAEVASIRSAILLGGAAMLVLGLVASALLARRIARPLEAMEEAAARIAAGDPAAAVPVEGPVEVARLAESLNRMAAQIRGRVEAETAARAQLESVLAGMVEGVVAVDGSGRVLFMNGAAAGLLGLPAPLAAGADPRETVAFPALEASLEGALAGRSPDPVDAPAPGGRERILGIQAATLGGGAGAVAILRDVTGERRLDAMRREFVANVSHELQTPLAAIAGALETLEGGGLDDAERAAFLQIAQRNTVRLRALVQDILDLSAIESKAADLVLVPVDLAGVLQVAAARLAEAAARAGVDLRIEPSPRSGIQARGNAARLEQAFVNLMENALKYTPAGGRVSARILERGRDVSVEVEDTGIGIPAASLPRLFERFYRVDPSRSRQAGGTGLGLSIVKHIALAHHGRVEVRSAEGSGTTFTVTLPLA